MKQNVINECCSTVENGVNRFGSDIEKYYRETKSPFFFERIKTFNIEKLEAYLFVFYIKKEMYDENTFNKLVNEINKQLGLIRMGV